MIYRTVLVLILLRLDLDLAFVCCKLDVKATILIREEANLGWIGERRMHANESNLQKVLSSLRRKANVGAQGEEMDDVCVDRRKKKHF